MKKVDDVFQIDAFTNEPFMGNSAGVVFADDLIDEEMQLIARELNVSETAFISRSDKADFNLRWFTPEVEVKLCGHATIASMHYLAELGKINSDSVVTFNTLSGTLNCKSKNDLYYLDLPTPKSEIFKGNREEILKALSLKAESINIEHPFLVTDKSCLFIQVKSLEELKKITPDFPSLRRLTGQKKEFEAVTVFTTDTFEDTNSAHLRFFAPAFGIDEDPVTGSANGPLLPVLIELELISKDTEGKTFIFEQGDFIGRKGRVFVTYSQNGNKLSIAGNAITVLRGELRF